MTPQLVPLTDSGPGLPRNTQSQPPRTISAPSKPPVIQYLRPPPRAPSLLPRPSHATLSTGIPRGPRTSFATLPLLRSRGYNRVYLSRAEEYVWESELGFSGSQPSNKGPNGTNSPHFCTADCFVLSELTPRQWDNFAPFRLLENSAVSGKRSRTLLWKPAAQVSPPRGRPNRVSCGSAPRSTSAPLRRRRSAPASAARARRRRRL